VIHPHLHRHPFPPAISFIISNMEGVVDVDGAGGASVDIVPAGTGKTILFTSEVAGAATKGSVVADGMVFDKLVDAVGAVAVGSV
jgi:hypothetical protein